MKKKETESKDNRRAVFIFERRSFDDELRRLFGPFIYCRYEAGRSWTLVTLSYSLGRSVVSKLRIDGSVAFSILRGADGIARRGQHLESAK